MKSGRVAEASIVFGSTVGVSLASILWSGRAARAAVAFTDVHLFGIVAFELLIAALLVPWLRRRGWSPREVAGDPSPLDIVRGIGVWLLGVGCYTATFIIFYALQPEVARALASEPGFPGAAPSAAAVVLVSVVNPVFEEFLWLGYGVTRHSPGLGVRGAAALSVVLRTLVHLYQGPALMLGVLPLGVAFTWYFVRTRRLWPVVVAHALFDAMGLVYRMSTEGSG